MMKTGTAALRTVLVLMLIASFSAAKPDEGLPLDLALGSLDADFEHCEGGEVETFLLEVLNKEMLTNEKLKNAWNKFAGTKDVYERALKVYTDKENGIYSELNKVVRTGDMSHFAFLALHYLITCGIHKRHQEMCMTTYRRTDLIFNTNVLGKEMRFGSFASTSFRDDLKEFGTKTCFIIKTCHGADISSLSQYPKEQEVLIPPTEKFIIKDVKKDVLGCNNVYSLQSTGILSNKNSFVPFIMKYLKKG